jgi:drug/metabolite transporter (DMT)-like permease
LHPIPLPVFLLSGIINLINAIILIPIMLLTTPLSMIHLTLFQLGILTLVSMASGLFYVFWYWGCTKVDTVISSLSTAIMPIATLIIAWLALGEMITAQSLIGMGFIICSILFYARLKTSIDPIRSK